MITSYIHLEPIWLIWPLFFWGGVKPTLNKKDPFQAQQGPFRFDRIPPEKQPYELHELAAWLDIVEVKDIYQDSFLSLHESLDGWDSGSPTMETGLVLKCVCMCV